MLVLTCSLSTLVRGVLNVRCLWIASEQADQKERDKCIHYTVLADMTLLPEFISFFPCASESELAIDPLSADLHLFG
jgi:hypothetical protein